MAERVKYDRTYYTTTVLDKAAAWPSIEHAKSKVTSFRNGKTSRGLMTPAQTKQVEKLLKLLNDAQDEWDSLTKQLPYTAE